MLDPEFALAILVSFIQRNPVFLAVAFFVIALGLFRVVRNRRLTRVGKAREYAATHCKHGVNKFTRSCRKCARDFEQECRQGGVPKEFHDAGLPHRSVGLAQAPGEGDVLKAVRRAHVMAEKHGTSLVEVTVRFKGFDGTTYARKLTLGANEQVGA